MNNINTKTVYNQMKVLNNTPLVSKRHLNWHRQLNLSACVSANDLGRAGTHRHFLSIPGGQKNGTVDTVDFQDFALTNSYRFHLAG